MQTPGRRVEEPCSNAKFSQFSVRRPALTRHNNQTASSILLLQDVVLWEHKNRITWHLYFIGQVCYQQFQSAQMRE
jgi:hypothetical protein